MTPTFTSTRSSAVAERPHDVVENLAVAQGGSKLLDIYIVTMYHILYDLQIFNVE